MENFLLILVLIFVSPSATTVESHFRSFESCNTTSIPSYEVCKLVNSSSVLVGINRTVENQRSIGNNVVEQVPAINLYFYPVDNSSCSTPTIIEVPEGSYRGLSGLRSVHMECTQFRTAVYPFRHYYSLRRLILINNKLTEFPQEFLANLVFLELISIQDQQIKALSPDSFTDITQLLEHLDLENIQLETIEPQTFTRFWNLKTLDLRRNRLEILRPDMFHGLDRLKTLHLGNNRIRRIEPGTFASVTGLHQLFLQTNRLVELPTGIFRDLKNLEVLAHSGNPISSSILTDGLDKLKVVYWGVNETIKVKFNNDSIIPTILLFIPHGWFL